MVILGLQRGNEANCGVVILGRFNSRIVVGERRLCLRGHPGSLRGNEANCGVVIVGWGLWL